MFSDKLNYYDKPCKWMKFLLNVWWPLQTLFYGGMLAVHFYSWHSRSWITFIVYLLALVILLSANLLARLLEKISLIALIAGQGVIVAVGLMQVILAGSVLLADYSSALGQTAGAFHGSAELFAAAGRIMKLSFFLYLAGFLTGCGVAAATVGYLVKRRDLFLLSEKEIRRAAWE